MATSRRAIARPMPIPFRVPRGTWPTCANDSKVAAQIARFNADAVVPHRDFDLGPLPRGRKFDAASAWSELGGVIE